jgi:hypothetical protein
MLTYDFSQLPVYSRPAAIKGVVSWRTIGTRASLRPGCETVQASMEPATTVDIGASLFDAVELVAENDYVVVLENRSVAGILTASDFSLQFRALAEPFLLIGEIENGLRQLLDGRFELSDLPQYDGRALSGQAVTTADLTFGDYLHLFASDAVWERIGLSLDRKTFRSRLDDVRKSRNKVMHFRPGGLEMEELDCLQAFGRFIRRLDEVRCKRASTSGRSQ